MWLRLLGFGSRRGIQCRIRRELIRTCSTKADFSQKVRDGPSLADFTRLSGQISGQGIKRDELDELDVPYLPSSVFLNETPKTLFVETYGCQMNVADTEIIFSIMKKAGYEQAEDPDQADVVFLNTCAIRDKAEQKIWIRLSELKKEKHKRRKIQPLTVGVLGCMAERLKTKLLESDKMVDLVVGPDAYRDLPRLLRQVEGGEQTAINTLLSLEETYADITPVRTATNGISAFVSIMRGCNNMCSYCIVPFTRGRERSRPITSLEDEVRLLSDQGFKEVTLLGQNVNSYNDLTTSSSLAYSPASGFRQMSQTPSGGVRFPELLDRLSRIDPEMRIRFTSPHPKDFPDDLLQLMAERPNLCKNIHIPAQSGSTSVLDRMRRGYTREAYLTLIDRIREIIPECALSSDFISGFCGETQEEHEETLSLLKLVKYDHAFMFAYSLREKTHAHRTLIDDVPHEIKQKRLREVISTFYELAEKKNVSELGKVHLLLVERTSRRSSNELIGRTDTNKKVVVPQTEVASDLLDPVNSTKVQLQPGDYVAIKIVPPISSTTLRGEPIAKTTSMLFNQVYSNPQKNTH